MGSYFWNKNIIKGHYQEQHINKGPEASRYQYQPETVTLQVVSEKFEYIRQGIGFLLGSYIWQIGHW